MVETREKRYYIFTEGSDIMFVMNIQPELLDEAMIKSFLHEVHARGLDSIIDPDVEKLIKSAKQGQVIRIGGAEFREKNNSATETAESVQSETEPKELPFLIDISPDSMQAHFEITNVSGTLARGDIEYALKQNGICHGIIEKNIDAVVRDWPRVFRVLIAQGSPPEKGADGRLEDVKQVKASMAPKIVDEDFVDFKHLDLIETIEAGEVLQIKIPPTEGVAGSDIFGHVIKPEPGKNVRLQKGKNTEISEDGSKLVSSVGGILDREPDGNLTVRPVYTVNGDVAYSTGIIDYKGDVVVKGDVRAGFAVIAGGDVQIYGAVEDAEIRAGGNVIIRGGIVSSGTARIKADGDVTVGFVKHGNIDAKGSVYIRIESIGSKISAGGDVEIIRSEGRIVGGEINAGGWITAPTFGSEKGPLLILKLDGMPGETVPDRRFAYSFASTKSVLSPVEIRFGTMITKLSVIHIPITVSIKDGKITIENIFRSSRDLKFRRKIRERDIIEKKSGSNQES